MGVLGAEFGELGLEGLAFLVEFLEALADAGGVGDRRAGGVVAELGELGDQPLGRGLVAGELPAELGGLGVAVGGLL